MKANKEEALKQIRGVLRQSKKMIAAADTEKDRATGLAMCKGYLQAFYFCGIINREEYRHLEEELETYRRMDTYRRGLERRGA